MAHLQIELPEFDLKILPEWPEFSKFLLLMGHHHANVRTKCTFIKKSCKNKPLHRQVKTALRKSSNGRNVLNRLEQVYPVYETDQRLRTEIEELPSFSKFPYLRGCGGAGRADGAYESQVLWGYRTSSFARREDPSRKMGQMQEDIREDSRGRLLC